MKIKTLMRLLTPTKMKLIKLLQQTIIILALFLLTFYLIISRILIPDDKILPYNIENKVLFLISIFVMFVIILFLIFIYINKNVIKKNKYYLLARKKKIHSLDISDIEMK